MDRAVVKHVREGFLLIAALATPLLIPWKKRHSAFQREDIESGTMNKAPVTKPGIPPGTQEVIRNWYCSGDLDDLALAPFLSQSLLIVDIEPTPELLV